MGTAVARYQIKDLAAKQNISLYRLARLSKTNEARLRLLANNKLDNVTVRTLELIAAALNRPLRDVFEPSSLDEVPSFVEEGNGVEDVVTRSKDLETGE